MTVIMRGARIRIPKGTRFVVSDAPTGRSPQTHARRSHDAIITSYARGLVFWAGPGGYTRAARVTPELLTLWGETQ
jgi:hypothetical protein